MPPLLYCEQPTTTRTSSFRDFLTFNDIIQQPANAWSSLFFVFVGFFILWRGYKSLVKFNDYWDRIGRYTSLPTHRDGTTVRMETQYERRKSNSLWRRVLSSMRINTSPTISTLPTSSSSLSSVTKLKAFTTVLKLVRNNHHASGFAIRSILYFLILAMLSIGSFWFHAQMGYESGYGDFAGMIGLVGYFVTFSLTRRPHLPSGLGFLAYFFIITGTMVGLRVMADKGMKQDVTLVLFGMALVIFGVGEWAEYRSSRSKSRIYWKPFAEYETVRNSHESTATATNGTPTNSFAKMGMQPALPSKSGVSLSNLIIAGSILVLSFGLWSLDNWRIVCDPSSLLQLHAVWHILNSVATYFAWLHMSLHEKVLSKCS